MRLVLMGPPGAGKGTQGQRLADEAGVPRLSTGDILRAAVRAGTERGLEASRYMDVGELVPDEVILSIVEEALARGDAKQGFVFDGFPRTVVQAEGLDRVLADRGEALDAVIDLTVPTEELVRRLTRRRVCESCGFAVRIEMDEEGEVPCARCGGKLVQRVDDRPATVERRLEVNTRETGPVLEWYRASATPVVEVDGRGSVAEVYDRLLEALDG